MKNSAISLIFLFAFLNFTDSSAGQSVDLSWNPSTSPSIVGYNVYRGTSPSGPYTKLNSSLDPSTEYTDATVQAGQTYYYATTAVNSQGEESGYSNQCKATIPESGAGSENVLSDFAGSGGPKVPYAGLMFDNAGNLYGTTELGGSNNQGTVFELTPNSNGVWTQTVLYNFTGNADGGQPYGGLLFDSAGNLYGTTNVGGSTNCSQGCGTVFKLTPDAGGWTESVVYPFTGGSDGRGPSARLLFDSNNNLYGTTALGGNVGSGCSAGCGTVFKLTPTSGGWTESVLYAFQGGADGASPYDGLAFDAAGNLYGTASAGGTAASGVVFKLTRGSNGWSESVIHAFSGGGDGKYPYGDLIFDSSGNLYGTAFQGGRGYGVVFELEPNSKGRWAEKVLHSFANAPAGNPVAGLVMDSAQNLYGTTLLGETESACGGGCGTLFKLSPSAGGWSYKVLHRFGQGTDGYHPSGDLILDASGNIYGTTQAGGTSGSGTVFQIMH